MATTHVRTRQVHCSRLSNNEFGRSACKARKRFPLTSAADAVAGHKPPVGVAVEFSGKPPLTRRPAIPRRPLSRAT